MFNKFICLIFGHNKYQPKALNGQDFIELKDKLGCQLVAINICERCKKVYAEFKA